MSKHPDHYASSRHKSASYYKKKTKVLTYCLLKIHFNVIQSGDLLEVTPAQRHDGKWEFCASSRNCRVVENDIKHTKTGAVTHLD